MFIYIFNNSPDLSPATSNNRNVGENCHSYDRCQTNTDTFVLSFFNICIKHHKLAFMNDMTRDVRQWKNVDILHCLTLKHW